MEPLTDSKSTICDRVEYNHSKPKALLLYVQALIRSVDYLLTQSVRMGRMAIRKHSLILFFLVFIGIVLFSSLSSARILVISPHPDDDIITAAGIIYQAVNRGEFVQIVFITNGDIHGTELGYQRQTEAVNAQVEHLGTIEDDLIFLGYPDENLREIFDYYPGQDDSFTTWFGQSTTYGNRGLGRTDYHSYRFGSPAQYNRHNMLLDLEDIVSNFMPDHIFTVSEFDQHSDHSTSYELLNLALLSVSENHPDYRPTVHKTIVHSSGSWPEGQDPTSYFSEVPNLSQTDLTWTNRESIDVPLSMQSTNYPCNPKYLAVSEHQSQGGTTGFLGLFIHKDEFFWVENLLSINQPPTINAGIGQTVVEGELVYLDGSGSSDPDGDPLTYQWQQTAGILVDLSDSTIANPTFISPSGLTQDEVLTFDLVVSDGELSSVADSVNITVQAGNPTNYNIASLATVTASSETPLYDQLAVKATDGVIDGYPGDYTCEWATAGEGSGAWIQLSWDVPYSVDRIIFYDRPNTNDHIESATLSFGDGSSLAVGSLNNYGMGVEYTFTPKVITSLTLTVDEVSSSTANIGLAEVEIFGSEDQGGNHAPVADAGIGQTVVEGELVYLDGSGSSDPDGDPLTYQWQQTAGILVDLSDSTIANPTFISPSGLTQDEVLTFDLVVSDGELSSVADSVNITVQAGNPTNYNIASLATVTASSETPLYDQLAVKATDGVIDGYPGDYTCEWATAGEGSGAWIQLSWDVPYSVDRIIFYDRPNTNDHIESATLSFGDGSSLAVGSLNNYGMGVEYTFTPKVITSLTLTVDEVSSSTANIGLAEVEIFGSED